MSSKYYRQRLADLQWAGILPQMFIRRTELSATPKLLSGDGTPPMGVGQVGQAARIA
jgi:hypothetical protein